MEERQDRTGQGERQQGSVGAPVGITEFLLARIAEDEAESALMGGLPYYDGGWSLAHEEHIRAECAAKLTIIERHSRCDDVSYGDASTCPEMRTLAAIYSDHSDYRNEWSLNG